MNIKETLDALRAFVQEEYQAGFDQLADIWGKPLSNKLKTGETQEIQSIKIESSKYLLVALGANESRFREGDMICLHYGDAITEPFVRQAMIEAENDGEWLVRAEYDKSAISSIKTPCYADKDEMDLRAFFEKALDDIAKSPNGRNIVLPLLNGSLETDFVYEDYDEIADLAEAEGLNEHQADAVGKGVAAKYMACIQGPPGTGKTKVISLIAKLLVEEGQSVLLTSHTHMAINNALNKIIENDVPTIKVGTASSNKGLKGSVQLFAHGDDWKERPDNGYVIGATPFATCSSRLENFEFDTVIFDEASQITVPLAVMAMRKAKRFVFVGDHKQLPPVVVSKSILDKESYSVFSRLILNHKKVSVILKQTYRMNTSLSDWPSQQYYNGDLVSVGKNSHRLLDLERSPARYKTVLEKNNPFVFIKSPGTNARTKNEKEALLIVDIIQTAIDTGMPPNSIGVVTPYRNHGKVIRSELTTALGLFTAKEIVTDTVERMQGQEREMVIISLCSTDEQFIQAVANFFFQPERLNVAITRPMTKLVLIGPELSKRGFNSLVQPLV